MKLEVGQTYLSRNGVAVTITIYDPHDDQDTLAYRAHSEGLWYNKDGTTCTGDISDNDLITDMIWGKSKNLRILNES